MTFMKKIALISDGWKKYMVAAWAIGIVGRIKEKNLDAVLYDFCCAGNWNQDEEYNKGERGIFSLPNMEELDGLIVDISNTRPGKELDLLMERLRSTHKPVISLQKRIEGSVYVGVDNYAAMRQIAAHLYEDHGYRKFWLMMGPEDNYESNERKRAVLDYLREKDIVPGPDDIVHADFDYQAGALAYRELRRTHDDLPDAIICVNDNQAIAVCEEASREGLKVPDDFAVTGFDNFDKAGFYDPRITTMENVREDMGALAVDCLEKIWNGEQVPDIVYNKVTFLKQESCGCHPPASDIRSVLKKQVLENIIGDIYSNELLDLESVLMRCATIRQVADAINEKLTHLSGEAFYMVIDPKLYRIAYEKKVGPDNDGDMLFGFSRGTYPHQMEVSYAREGMRHADCEDTVISDIFPLLKADRSGDNFLFLPLHFEAADIGYMVFKNVCDYLSTQMYFKVQTLVQKRMQEIFREKTIRNMYEQLATLFKTDALTGVLNREGYRQEGQEFYDRMIRHGKRVFVMFCDLDHLKYINDNYGHEAGDRAIKDIADTLTKVIGDDSVISRMGGDEFVVIARYTTEDDIADMKMSIEKNFIRLKAREDLPYNLSVSIGISVTGAGQDQGLEHFIREADQRMYSEKIKHRTMSPADS